MPDDPVSMSAAGLFPEIEPFATGFLPVGDGHEIYFEQCGNPAGVPALFLHGGPASGCSTRHRRFFDPARYRICLFDQRGSGRSRPTGLRDRTETSRLVADIERLRGHLAIDQWLVFGGSWGSALALAYAGEHRSACLGLVLRGIFLTGHADMDWFFRQAGMLAPDAWSRFAGHVGGDDFESILAGYVRALEVADSSVAQAATAHWLAWEATVSAPGKTPVSAARFLPVSLPSVLKYRLQASYLQRFCDLDEAGVLAAADRAAGLPVAIVHGRLDQVCRPINAWTLARRMPGSRLRLLADSAHDPYDPAMLAALIGATNGFAASGDFRDWPCDGNQS